MIDLAAADPGAMSDTSSPVVYDIKQEVTAALVDFYRAHVEGNLQIFHSLTLGEIVIAILLAAILLVLVFKWIWEAVAL